MVDKHLINIELVYIQADSQNVIKSEVEAGSTIESVITGSGLLECHPEIDLARNKVGVFSVIRPLDYQLNEGDRVEIYRPLRIDPKEARRQRAKNNN